MINISQYSSATIYTYERHDACSTNSTDSTDPLGKTSKQKPKSCG